MNSCREQRICQSDINTRKLEVLVIDATVEVGIPIVFPYILESANPLGFAFLQKKIFEVGVTGLEKWKRLPFSFRLRYCH